MKVSVVGTGYVGLVSGVCLSAKGHQVVCIDIDENKVNKINQGIPPIYEEGLEDLLKANIGTRLTASTDLRDAVLNSQISLIAVGTPFKGDEIDLKYVKEVARQIGTVLKDKDDYHLVVVKSTVVPGTSDEVVLSILEEASGKKAGVDFGVGMNPEFLKEGEAIKDFMNPDRIVLGGIDERSIALLRELYDVFEGVDKLETNCKTAEMIKYTANSLLATMISFANEIGNLSAAVGGIDVVEVMRGVHLDKRLTPILDSGERIIPSFTTYIEAGCGFGGSCFPKDVKALNVFGAQQGQSMQLLESVIAVNAEQYKQVMTRLYKHFPNLDAVKVAVLGLAFKPGTDDMRESPAIPVVQELLKGSAKVKAYDPVATHEAQKLFENEPIQYCESLAEAIEGVDAILVMTRWAEFNALPEMLSTLAEPPLVVDGRRMLDKSSIARYEGVGL
ncbi:UDP-glucose/GDP-mannose dehydrogenase family protein [Pseudanabaena sp. FACHB-2040]|uniref:UDP-glucose dehydrogenase family protein n=1 Tax=Pseudanabaena sp. FACHB-2040 TaxID=2692859 RepID=UPI001682E3B5|nr:UDP-glucose/GDP-mannose dehydrogenase family protein [Pseudanabaena sp. FACHB-2040]MBD0269640.1 UDP-glucose/GDP-mannose dehydrogenase family protein [Cyanobacteria bacterium Co-bin8]MBD2257776.1 UDP-glucose/GDP-mannose dehydrogenase family protein [Pseudanabaena sp. FACHB-2040]